MSHILSHDLRSPIHGFCIVIVSGHAVKLFADALRVAKPFIHNVGWKPLQCVRNGRRSKIVEELWLWSDASMLQDLVKRPGVILMGQARQDEFGTVRCLMESLLKIT